MSGPGVTVPAPGAHIASPKDGTYTTGSGVPADVLNAADYPVTAACKFCGAPVRLDYLLQWEWRHAAAVLRS